MGRRCSLRSFRRYGIVGWNVISRAGTPVRPSQHSNSRSGRRGSSSELQDGNAWLFCTKAHFRNRFKQVADKVFFRSVEACPQEVLIGVHGSPWSFLQGPCSHQHGLMAMPTLKHESCVAVHLSMCEHKGPCRRFVTIPVITSEQQPDTS